VVPALVWLFAGCEALSDPPAPNSQALTEDSTEDDTAPVGPGDLGLDVLPTRVPGDLDLVAEISETMPTVALVTWSGRYPGSVTYDVGVETYRIAGHRVGERHEAWLVGCAPEHPLDFHLEGRDGLGTFATDWQRLHTDSLEQVQIELDQVLDQPAEVSLGLVLMAWVWSGGKDGLSLVDRNGEIVWSWLTPDSHAIAAAEWTGSGAWVLLQETAHGGEPGKIVFVRADGEVTAEIEAAGAHHQLEVLPDGAVAWLEAEERIVEGLGSVVGDIVMEQSPDGERRVTWSTWDTLPIDPGPMWDST